MKAWQVGILGLGHWYSAYNLARALREFPRATLVGAAWTHRTHLDEFASTFGVTRSTTTTRCSPAPTSTSSILPAPTSEIPDLAVRAARAGKHIILGKPIRGLLLAGTGATVRGLIGLYRTSLGYDPHHVIIASINLPENSYTEWADRAALYERLRSRMADVPQVESVALATHSGIPPLSGERSVVEVPGRDMTGDQAPIVQRISAHYFATMKIPLIRGRFWSDSEGAGAPHVAVINQTMARERWPDESPIGRRVLSGSTVSCRTRCRADSKNSASVWRSVPVAGAS